MTLLALRQIVERALADVGVDPRFAAAPRGRPRTTTWLGFEPGFGLRHYASGRQIYILQARMGGRVRTVTIGPATVITRFQAQMVARQVLAHARVGQDPASERQRIRKVPRFDDFMEEYWQRCSPTWKASTRSTQGQYRRLYLDIAFPDKSVDEIDEADVAGWFTQTTDRSGPGGANRTIAILKAAFNKAEAWGYRPEGTNPCRAIKPNRGRKGERHLSGAEMKRLGKVLEGARKGEDRYRSICASAILLLILTGCRCSEIMTAQWRDICGKRLRLRDSKTGPRTVWLGPEARRIIDELPRWKGVPHLFWNPVCARPTRYPGLAWQSFQSEAGLSGVRLHDLRHTYASQAAMGAETLPMIARLLGHANVKSTARYAHHDDAHVLEAVQRVGDVVALMIGCKVGR